MEAKELMLGDWIISPTGKTRQMHKQDFINDNIWFDDCKPIPLTNEILEANCFTIGYGKQVRSAVGNKLISTEGEINDMHSYICVRVETKGKNDYGHTAINIVSIDRHSDIYVHELQHALRLVGLIGLAEIVEVFKVK